MIFNVVRQIPLLMEDDVVYLHYIDFDDFGYCTTYEVYAKSSNGSNFNLGIVKIGCHSLCTKVEPSKSLNGYDSFSINKIMPVNFSKENPLPCDFFSLGGNIQYYKNLRDIFAENVCDYYDAMRDIAYDFERFANIYRSGEACLINSLLRGVRYSDVEQLHRVSKNECELTKYDFKFFYNNSESVDFLVDPDSLPPSNIHVLIGRNGVGKTWLLYHIAVSVLKSMEISFDDTLSVKYSTHNDFRLCNHETIFAGVVGVSFSVFDDGLSSIKMTELDGKIDELERKRIQEEFGQRYKYIGIIKNNDPTKNSNDPANPSDLVSVKTVNDLSMEFEKVLKSLASNSYKKLLYLDVYDSLETDEMFRDNGFIDDLKEYFTNYNNISSEKIIKSFKRLSSGHMIIILSLLTLCEAIHEKTIVLIDEPETHLHPPLLSTYIRTLSVLLKKRNAVGIIATHSPIVLQEVPRSCVTKVERVGGEMTFYRPETETFAAGTDQLTREVFGYEIMKTGFYKLIGDNLKEDFEKTYKSFHKQIGFLGQIMIQGLLNRNRGDEDEKDR